MSIIDAQPEKAPLISHQPEVGPERERHLATLEAAGQLAIKSPVHHVESDFDAATSPYRVDHRPSELIAGLSEQVLTQRDADGGTYGPVVAVRMEGGSPFADVARYVEAVWFKEWEGYLKLTPEKFAHEMYEDYSPYDDDSKFILLMHMENRGKDGLPDLVGMARAVGGRVDLLKTVVDMPGVWGRSRGAILADIRNCDKPTCVDVPVEDPAKTWDYSSLAVAEGYRGSQAWRILSHELYRWSREHDVQTVTTILVHKFTQLFQLTGVPFRPILDAKTRVHMEEPSDPLVMHLPELALLERSRHRNPQKTYHEMVLGENFTHFRANA